MHKSDIALEKYWVTQSGYFRLETTVTLGMGITHGKLLYCNGVAQVNVDKKNLTLDYNNRTVYDCLNNPFTAYFGSPDMHLPPITIDDRPRPHKRDKYNPYIIPAEIYVASENYVSTLTTPSDSPYILPTDDPNALHVMKTYMPLEGRVKNDTVVGNIVKNMLQKDKVLLIHML